MAARGLRLRRLGPPANVLLEANGDALLAGFGLARATFNDSIIGVPGTALAGTEVIVTLTDGVVHSGTAFRIDVCEPTVTEYVALDETGMAYFAADQIKLEPREGGLAASLRFQTYNVGNPSKQIDQLLLAADLEVLAFLYHGIPGGCPGVFSNCSQTNIALQTAGVAPTAETGADQGASFLAPIGRPGAAVSTTPGMWSSAQPGRVAITRSQAIAHISQAPSM